MVSSSAAPAGDANVQCEPDLRRSHVRISGLRHPDIRGPGLHGIGLSDRDLREPLLHDVQLRYTRILHDDLCDADDDGTDKQYDTHERDDAEHNGRLHAHDAQRYRHNSRGRHNSSNHGACRASIPEQCARRDRAYTARRSPGHRRHNSGTDHSGPAAHSANEPVTAVAPRTVSKTKSPISDPGWSTDWPGSLRLYRAGSIRQNAARDECAGRMNTQTIGPWRTASLSQRAALRPRDHGMRAASRSGAAAGV